VADKYEWEAGTNIPIPHRVGFFDIEASGLKANFGIMLCYCIKDSESDKIYEYCISKKEMEKDLDKKVIQHCVEDLSRFDRIVTYFGCVTPGHRVLTSDLRWVPVETLQEGDTLLSFDEESNEFWHKRKYAKSTVVHNIPIQKEIFEIRLEDGTTLEATEDHPWLVKRGQGSRSSDKEGYWKFRKTNELQHFNCKEPSLFKLLPTWDTLKSYEAGYVSAFVDGEGSIGQPKKSEERSDYGLSVIASQNEGAVLDRYLSSLKDIGYESSTSRYDPSNRKCVAVQIRGGKANVLKFLGEVRPQKLSKLDINKIGIIHQYGEPIPIVSIKSKGIGTVMGLGVSNGTYIVEGFGSHNSRFDFPFTRTRAVYHNLYFPHYKELLHTDLFFVIRNRFSLGRKSLESAYNMLVGESHKTHYGRDHWVKALTGNEKALSYILDHCRWDVKDLEELYYKVENFSMKRDMSI